MRISISAQSLFNHYPRFVSKRYGTGYDQENSSLMGGAFGGTSGSTGDVQSWDGREVSLEHLT
jgi:hypothetical protein